jgi:hypothetical protein
MPSIPESLQRGNNGEIFVRLTFEHGLNTATSEFMVQSTECTAGENFQLKLDNIGFKPRQPIELLGTATNGQAIRGFAELIKSDGSVTCLVQAGDTVYSYDGQSTFTSLTNVNAASRLRGTRFSTSLTDDKVIITDLEKLEAVKTWDGTTVERLNHNLSSELYAAYCIFDKERALFGNVRTSTDTPHLLVGSARDDILTLSIANRPSSALGEGDPFFIPMPDLRRINGLVGAFGDTLISTTGDASGSFHRLSGESAKDFTIDTAFQGSGAAGREPVVSLGNDVLWGRTGKIESLVGVEAFGDTNADDASRWIANQIEDVSGWDGVYNPRTRKAYFWAEDGNEVWVLSRAIYNPILSIKAASRAETLAQPSPWSKWTTDFGNGDFRAEAQMLVRNPATKKDEVWFGDQAGRIFRMEGVGTQDGGSSNITATRTSGIIAMPTGNTYNVSGRIFYRKTGAAATVTLDFISGGIALADEQITVSIPALTGAEVYNSGAYYGGSDYYGLKFSGRLNSQEFRTALQKGFFQVKATITGAETFDIHAIEIDFRPTA